MSLAAYALAVRNHLRDNLDPWYGTPPNETRDRNCKIVTPKMLCTPDCGREFIGVYGTVHKPRQVTPIEAFDEVFGLTIAVTLRINDVPADYRGEGGYVKDDDKFVFAWLSIEARCRQIVGLVGGTDRYTIMAAANTLLTTGSGFTEPLAWLGTDAAPSEVGAEHFSSFHDPYGNKPADADNTYGLLMKIRFGEAVRFQTYTQYDAS